MTLKFDMCHRRWAAMMAVKYKRDIQQLACFIIMLKNRKMTERGKLAS